MTANFAKNLPRAHARQAEVCALAATEFPPGNCTRLCEAVPKSVAVESGVLAEIFRGLNQEARKAGEDQELLEIHGFVASKFESHASFPAFPIS